MVFFFPSHHPSFVPSHDFSGAANLLQKAPKRYYRLLLKLVTKPKRVVSVPKTRWHVQSVPPFRPHTCSTSQVLFDYIIIICSIRPVHECSIFAIGRPGWTFVELGQICSALNCLTI